VYGLLYRAQRRRPDFYGQAFGIKNSFALGVRHNF
jgi:hypothetical protein